MMNNGWIKVHRKILEWEWYNEPNTFRLFFHILLKANHKPNKYRGVLIETGQIMTGLHLLSNETGLSVRSVRTCLNRLKSTNEITIKTSTQGSIIQIVKYSDYQIQTSEVTNERQTNDKRTTTNKNDNNIKKNIYTDFEFLEDWKLVREKKTGKPTNIKKLSFAELNNFKEVSTEFSRNEFREAMQGLFMQKDIFAATVLRPDHFLRDRNIEKYLDAFKNKTQLFAKKQITL